MRKDNTLIIVHEQITLTNHKDYKSLITDHQNNPSGFLERIALSYLLIQYQVLKMLPAKTTPKIGHYPQIFL